MDGQAIFKREQQEPVPLEGHSLWRGGPTCVDVTGGELGDQYQCDQEQWVPAGQDPEVEGALPRLCTSPCPGGNGFQAFQDDHGAEDD